METDMNIEENRENHIYLLYKMAVNIFDQLEHVYTDCKEGYKAWSDFQYLQSICSDEINKIIHEENVDLYFTTLLEIQGDLFSIAKTVEAQQEQITYNDVTITRINPQSDPFPLHFQSLPVVETYTPEEKVMKIEKPNLEDKLQNAIKNTITDPKSNGLCDIAGMEQTISLLKEAIIFPMQFPHLFTGGRKSWNKALLYGPPGTGKTQLARSVAAEINGQFYHVSHGDLLSRYVGESEKLIRTLFQHNQNSGKRCIIFIDEIDGICRRRNSKEAEYERRIKNELLNQLSDFDTNSENTVFFLAATNCPWDLDPAFIRRFQRRIYVPLPDRVTRLQILKLFSKSVRNTIDDKQWSSILDKTEGWSGSDIADLVNCAMYQPVKTLESATNWIITDDQKYMPVDETEPMAIKRDIKFLPADQITVRDVNIGDYFTALHTATKTVSDDELKKYEEFNRSFGSLKNILHD